MTEPDRPAGRAVRWSSYAVLLVLTLQASLGGAVLLLWRPFGVPAPVGLLVALLIGPLCWWGASLLGRRAGAVGPFVIWLAMAMVMTTQRREGDLLVGADLKGYAFLLGGSLSAAVATGAWVPRTSSGAVLRRSTPRGGVPAR